MAESIDLILYGHPPVSEIRERALFDLRHDGRKLKGDVDMTVRVTVLNRRCLVPVTACHAAVAEVIAAAVKAATIESGRSVRSISYLRPVVDGLDVVYVSFVSSDARHALI